MDLFSLPHLDFRLWISVILCLTLGAGCLCYFGSALLNGIAADPNETITLKSPAPAGIELRRGEWTEGAFGGYEPDGDRFTIALQGDVNQESMALLMCFVGICLIGLGFLIMFHLPTPAKRPVNSRVA